MAWVNGIFPPCCQVFEMDSRMDKLQTEFDDALQAAAEAALRLEEASPDYVKVPHYSSIERHAHEVGRQVSQLIQQRRVGLVAIEAGRHCSCPGCGKQCESPPASGTLFLTRPSLM